MTYDRLPAICSPSARHLLHLLDRHLLAISSPPSPPLSPYPLPSPRRLHTSTPPLHRLAASPPRLLAASPPRRLTDPPPITYSPPPTSPPPTRPLPTLERSCPVCTRGPLALNPARHSLSVPALRRSHLLRRLHLEICGARTSCGDSTPVPAAPAPPAASAHAPQCLRRSRTPCGACTSMPAAFAPPAAPAQPYLRRSHPLRRLHQSSQRGEQSGRALPA